MAQTTTLVDNDDYSTRLAAWEVRRSVETNCRSYWQKRYGPQAEIDSRGGVTWMCGAKPSKPRSLMPMV